MITRLSRQSLDDMLIKSDTLSLIGMRGIRFHVYGIRSKVLENSIHVWYTIMLSKFVIQGTETF